jgi:hypothetical protein
MLTIADVARQCGLPYGEFYALVWHGRLPRPTHHVPLLKGKRYTADEASAIVRRVKEYKAAKGV